MHLHVALHLYTLYYTLNIAHCTTCVYTAFSQFITSHWKHPKFAWIGLRNYMANCTLIYWWGCLKKDLQPIGLPRLVSEIKMFWLEFVFFSCLPLSLGPVSSPLLNSVIRVGGDCMGQGGAVQCNALQCRCLSVLVYILWWRCFTLYLGFKNSSQDKVVTVNLGFTEKETLPDYFLNFKLAAHKKAPHRKKIN